MADPVESNFRLHDSLLTHTDIAAQFALAQQVQRMLDVELALAEAEAAIGIIPPDCVEPIRTAAHAELYDHARLAAEVARTGNPTIPVVQHLTRRVAETAPDAAHYVHWGATSQDILDTALVLQLRDTVSRVLGDTHRAAVAAAELARRHARTPQAGRTWLQQATPVTFGLKAAGWGDALERVRRQSQTALDEAAVLQFGGATGTLASLGSHGAAVAKELAERLGLGTTDIPWHAHRDRLAQLMCTLGVLTGVAGKIARDVALLAQTEINEVWEQPTAGRGGSSTMPHKRNPVGASVTLAAAQRMPGLVATVLGCMAHEHERGLGSWQAEWDALPNVVVVSGTAIRAIADTLEGLEVDPASMRRNLEATNGLILAEAIAMALAPAMGKADAHQRVEAACHRAVAEGHALSAVLAEDPAISTHLNQNDIERLLAPEQYLGAAQTFIDQVLSRLAT